MKLFVAEYFTSGQCPGITPDNSLYREGWGMLSSFLEDAARITVGNGRPLECKTVLGGEPLTPLAPEIEIHPNANPRQAWETVGAVSASVDMTVLIAPETEGILLQQHDLIRENGSNWLGCDRQAIEVCSDKLKLAELWNELGLPTPETIPVSELTERETPLGIPLVVKPRDGAGGDMTGRIETETEYRRFLDYLTDEDRQVMIAQPFVTGQACSVGVLSLSDGDQLFPPAQQRIDWEGGFRYLGGVLPQQLPTEALSLLHDFIRRTRSAISGLSGYWGLDFIWNPDDREQPITLIEINPRLTTSYLGYRKLTEVNLAELWIDDYLQIEGSREPLCWQEASISF